MSQPFDRQTASPCTSPDAEAPTTARGDWPALVRLLVDASPLNQSHWNPRTGEVFSLPRGRDRATRAEAFAQRLMAEDDWIEVPHLESDDAYQLAKAFAAGLHPGRGRAAVLQALAGAKPFRALRNVLAGAPGLQRRYQKAVHAEAELRLAELCLGLGLRLADPRFEAAVARLMALDEAEEAERDEGAFELPLPAAPTVRRSIAALSIGRGDDGDSTIHDLEAARRPVSDADHGRTRSRAKAYARTSSEDEGGMTPGRAESGGSAD